MIPLCIFLAVILIVTGIEIALSNEYEGIKILTSKFLICIGVILITVAGYKQGYLNANRNRDMIQHKDMYGNIYYVPKELNSDTIKDTLSH